MSVATKKQIKAYTKSEYPTYRRNNAADGIYDGTKTRSFISDSELKDECQAIIDLVNEGVGIKPSWM